MKVKVIDGWQVKHGGKVHAGGDTFEASEADAQKLIDGGLVTKVAAAKPAAKAQSSSKNKAQSSSKNKAG